MKHQMLNERIVTDPPVLLGKPIIRGTRVPVYLIVGLIETGQTPDQIVEDYPDLTVEDVKAAVAYAVQRQTTPTCARQDAVARFLLNSKEWS